MAELQSQNQQDILQDGKLYMIMNLEHKVVLDVYRDDNNHDKNILQIRVLPPKFENPDELRAQLFTLHKVSKTGNEWKLKSLFNEGDLALYPQTQNLNVVTDNSGSNEYKKWAIEYRSHGIFKFFKFYNIKLSDTVGKKRFAEVGPPGGPNYQVFCRDDSSNLGQLWSFIPVEKPSVN